MPQSSRSHETFKDQSTQGSVWAVTKLCVDGLPCNLIPMYSSLRRCAVTLDLGPFFKGQGLMIP